MGKKPALNPKAHTEYLKMPKLKSTAGFSLIEVLVTLLMVGISLLGMGMLQTRAIQYTHDSAQRNTAAILANDLIEIIRSSPNKISSFYKAKGSSFPSEANLSCSPLPQDKLKQLDCWAKNAERLLLSKSDADKTDNSNLLKDEFYICQADQSQKTGCGSSESIEIQLAWRVKEGECLDSESPTGTLCHYRLRTKF